MTEVAGVFFQTLGEKIHEGLLLLAPLPNNLGIYATQKHEVGFLLFSLCVAWSPDGGRL